MIVLAVETRPRFRAHQPRHGLLPSQLLGCAWSASPQHDIDFTTPEPLQLRTVFVHCREGRSCAHQARCAPLPSLLLDSTWSAIPHRCVFFTTLRTPQLRTVFVRFQDLETDAPRSLPDIRRISSQVAISSNSSTRGLPMARDAPTGVELDDFKQHVLPHSREQS